MPTIGDPTFDQLHLFLAVVETGSFAAAGRRLGRATSVVSYGIANLESQLGLVLFERAGTRRPQLTAAGKAVLAEARSVAEGIDGLKARVLGLRRGLEAEVALAVDVMLPAARLADVLKTFGSAFPTVALRLHVEALGAVAALVLGRTAGLGISGPLAAEAPELERRSTRQHKAHPCRRPRRHPLGDASQALAPGAARDHVQLVLSDRSSFTQGRDFGVVSARTWRLADLGAKHALLREGLGWGNMPLPMVADDLAAGRLVALALPDYPGEDYRFDAVWRRDAPPGPAAQWLLDRFAACPDFSI